MKENMGSEWRCVLPPDAEELFGEIVIEKVECPGVCYIAVREENILDLTRERYVVAVDSPAITQRAKQYGKAVPGHPELLIYFFEEERGGFKIIEYEVAKYRVENGYPLESGGTLHGIKLFNMEFHPEYFGPYPVPSITPVGRTRKHYTLQNGVYLLESDEGERVLSICYPIWSTELSDYSLSISKRIWSEGASTIENNSAERFFLAADICIPVYEMLAVR